MITVEFKRVGIKPGFKVLDIGCGSGRHVCAAYQHYDVTAVGADINFDDLSEARGRLNLHDQLSEHGNGQWALTAANVIRLPFQDDVFDLVICSEVLEHINEVQIAVDEIVRVLKPACNLVVSVPRSWPERLCWTLSTNYYQAEGGHIRIFKQKELIAELEAAGVKKWALHHAHSLHTPYWWLKCLLGPNRKDLQLVDLYHRFLTWDIMKQPVFSRFLDRLLNPVLGKSVVIYLRKEKNEIN